MSHAVLFNRRVIILSCAFLHKAHKIPIHFHINLIFINPTALTKLTTIMRLTKNLSFIVKTFCSSCLQLSADLTQAPAINKSEVVLGIGSSHWFYAVAAAFNCYMCVPVMAAFLISKNKKAILEQYCNENQTTTTTIFVPNSTRNTGCSKLP